LYEQDDMTGAAASYAVSTSWTDQTVQMDIRITDTVDSADRRAGPEARCTSDNNYYYIMLRESGTAELEKVQGGVVSVVDALRLRFRTQPCTT
jgi:hypothetical protein